MQSEAFTSVAAFIVWVSKPTISAVEEKWNRERLDHSPEGNKPWGQSPLGGKVVPRLTFERMKLFHQICVNLYFWSILTELQLLKFLQVGLDCLLQTSDFGEP